MNFNLTEERSMLQNMLQRYLSEKYAHESRQQVIESEAGYNSDIYKELADLGIIGALFSEEDGGFGGAGFDISTVFEELGRAGVIEPLLPSIMAGNVLAVLGTEQQRGVLAQVIAGKHNIAFAHGEAQARYELNKVSATAIQTVGQTQGLIAINGVKTHVVQGFQADSFVVSAREGGKENETQGISLFLVPGDSPGISRLEHINNDGVTSAQITFDNVEVPESSRLGEPQQVFAIIESSVSRGVLALCAEAIGLMSVIKELTVDYLKERKQFGTAIGKFQALQHRMADMLIEIEQAKSAVINLAGFIDKPRDVRERYTSAAKHLIGKVGTLVAEESIQMHGGIGMANEYALSHFVRRLVMIDHYLGDEDYHLERFIQLSGE